MSNAFPGVTDSSAGVLRPVARLWRNRLALGLTVFLGIGLFDTPANALLRSTSIRTTPVRTASIRTAAIKSTVKVVKTVARPVKVKPKAATGLSATAKPVAKPSTKKPRPPKPTSAPATAVSVPPEPTESTTTAPQARALPAPPVLAGAATTVTQPPAVSVTPAVISPLPTPAATIALVGAGTAITTPPAATTTTTTSIPPAPFPAPADPPKRATAGTLDPYRGLGTWVDRLDWTNLFSKNKPAVTLATIDQMAAQGIQTIYLQIPHWQTTPDIYEPERLQPIIDRAHALGMYVVGWYLPYLFDVNTDLRKVVAMANLDLDGIQIDIEQSGLASMSNVNLRNARLSEFNRSVRSLLPGRVISADIVAPSWMDGQTGRWSWPNYPPETRGNYWGGAFPYAEVVATYDLIALQLYWTNNKANSGWKDPQAFVLDNMNRMRAYTNRADYPIQAIGGVDISKSSLNDVIGYMDAAKASTSFGISLYDYTTTPSLWWQAMWGLRSIVDPRFPAPALFPYVPLAQPATPPVTTTTTTKAPPNVPAVVVGTSIPTVPAIEIVIK
jgi:hypothetical protein